MQYNNKNPKIFILSGKAKSGKNMVADIIEAYYTDKKCIQLSYAYYLKQYIKKITNWDGSEENKPRDLLQSLGIDLIKKIDQKLLIRRVMEDIKVYSYFYDVIIVTDARLIEEIEEPKRIFNCITVRINKDDNNLTEELSFDYDSQTNLKDTLILLLQLNQRTNKYLILRLFPVLSLNHDSAACHMFHLSELLQNPTHPYLKLRPIWEQLQPRQLP